MITYIPADNGNMVLAEGAPGSVARARVQFPQLIEKLRTMRKSGRAEADAHFVCASAGIHTQSERNAVLAASSFPPVTHSIEFNL